MDEISKFIDFMRGQNCGPANTSDIRDTSGRWIDFQLDFDPKNKKKGYYTLKIDGDYVSGAVGDRRSGETFQYRGKLSRKLTDEERREYVRRREEDRKAAESEKAGQHNEAADKSKKLWDAARPGDHPYAQRKGIDGGRVLDGLLLIPLYDAAGKLWNLQQIDAEGDKQFLFGGKKKGLYSPIALSSDPKDIIYITEGYATGYTVRKATGSVVVVAFDAGNLKHVAEVMRNKYPSARIIIAGDNDKSQTGQKSAIAAADAIGGIAVWPEQEDTDWNDLGIESAAEMLADRLRSAAHDASSHHVAGSDVAFDNAAEPSSLEVPDWVYEQEFAKSRELSAVSEWRDLLICNAEGKLIKGSLKNIMLFLQHHEDYQDVFRLNDFQKEIFIARCPPWESVDEFKVHRLEDNDISEVAASLERYGMAPDTDKVFKSIMVVAEKNSFHPAREYFNSLEWDGTNRLDTWLSYYLGAEGDDPEYLAFVGKKWLTAAVKRVFEPGCKFDHILVMEGEQGKGKSTAFEYLATFGRDVRESYFTDNIKLSDIQNKDTILLLQGSIIVELAELAGFKKQEDDEIKGWITTKEDRCRKPYGKTITHFPRQFILCGTTNNYEYLKDPTGNRRYWPFKSSAVDLKAIEMDREQLWAEAVELYKSGMYIGPTEEESALAKTAQYKRLTIDTWEDDVLNAAENLGILGFNTRQVFKEMGLGLKDQDAKNTRRITNILQQNGFVNEIRRIDGKSKRVWIRGS